MADAFAAAPGAEHSDAGHFPSTPSRTHDALGGYFTVSPRQTGPFSLADGRPVRARSPGVDCGNPRV